jgi:hypothetical protein
VEGKVNCVSEIITKMIEALPESLQERVLEEIEPIIAEAVVKQMARLEEVKEAPDSIGYFTLH